MCRRKTRGRPPEGSWVLQENCERGVCKTFARLRKFFPFPTPCAFFSAESLKCFPKKSSYIPFLSFHKAKLQTSDITHEKFQMN